jgi:hypothetical protein
MLTGELRVDKSAVSRRVREGVRRGYLKNQENRRGHPAKLVIADPMPKDVTLLPRAEELADERCSVDPEKGRTRSPLLEETRALDLLERELGAKDLLAEAIVAQSPLPSVPARPWPPDELVRAGEWVARGLGACGDCGASTQWWRVGEGPWHWSCWVRSPRVGRARNRAAA